LGCEKKKILIVLAVVFMCGTLALYAMQRHGYRSGEHEKACDGKNRLRQSRIIFGYYTVSIYTPILIKYPQVDLVKNHITICFFAIA
jgi:hypothetical protein